MTFSFYRNLLISIVFSTVLPGCIEHKFKIYVTPEDQINIVYEARGDRIDLEDGFDTFPDSLAWNLTRSKEESENETTHILAGSLDLQEISGLNAALDWKTSADDTIHLQRTFNLKKTQKLFGIAYIFNVEFTSFKFDELYGDIWDYIPIECKALDDEDQLSKIPDDQVKILESKFAFGLLQWNRIRYENRFKQTWEILKSRIDDLNDTTETSFSIAFAGWTDDLHQYLNNLEIEDPNTVNLEWWQDLGPIFLGRFIDLVGVGPAEMLHRITDELEKKYQIAKDVEDDQFHITIQLPGKTYKHSGNLKEEGIIEWTIPGKDVLNTSFQLEAESIVFSYWRIGVTALIVILLIGILGRTIKFKPARS